MRHELVAEVDLGAGAWAEVLVAQDGTYRILAHAPDETVDDVGWAISTLYGPFVLLEEVHDRLEALAAVHRDAN